MGDISYSAKIRALSKDYYQNHLHFDEYRAQRKIVFDKIDVEFNGNKSSTTEVSSEDQQKSDSANPSSVLMKTIAFFKNNDVNE